LATTKSERSAKPLAGSFVSGQDASSLVECAFLLPFLVLLVSGAIDLGQAWYANLELASAAEAGALYGVQNPNDVAGMQAASRLDAPDLATLQSTVRFGSECSDGTNSVTQAATVTGCSQNSVEYVEVDTSTVYKPLLTMPWLPSSFTMSSRCVMRSPY
jgi:Flp pilus assembly protein TadG